MSYAYAMQPPVGLGLLNTRGSSFLASTIRKRANEESPTKALLRKIAQNTMPTQTAPSAPTSGAPARGYDIFDRFRDFWNFIKHGVTLLWYKGRAAKGQLTPQEWKNFQEASHGMANNKTLRDVYKFWYGPQATQKFQRFSQLGTVADTLPHVFSLKKNWETYNDRGRLRAHYQNLRDTKGLTPEKLRTTLGYARRFGDMSEADYRHYTDVLPVLTEQNQAVGFSKAVGNKLRRIPYIGPAINRVSNWISPQRYKETGNKVEYSNPMDPFYERMNG